MKISVCIIAIALRVAPASANAQRPPVPDSLVTRFLNYGILSGWSAADLFAGCPRLDASQERGIQRLMSAELTLERLEDLARSWMAPLRDCNDRRLETWYLRLWDEAIARNEWQRYYALPRAIYNAKTPATREYMRNQMLNPDLPDQVRTWAGGLYFEHLVPDDGVTEFVRAFETGRLPFSTAWFWADRLMSQKPDHLLREIGERVRANVALANQTAFRQIVEASAGRVADDLRRKLGEHLDEGVRNAGATLSPELRAEMLEMAAFLRRPGPPKQ